jgi:YD repeat-containing protein
MAQLEYPLSPGGPLVTEVSMITPLPVAGLAAPVGVQIDNSAVNSQPLYVGTARAGSATSAAAWRIQKLVYDGNGNLSAVTWANVDVNGLPSAAEVWDNRASLTYA